MPLTLRADSLNVIEWWVETSFTAHIDYRGNTGATTLLVKGSIIGISKKRKINMRSSTESRLVGADAVMPQMVWGRYFIEAQGLEVE
jgi:hypothetical protein